MSKASYKVLSPIDFDGTRHEIDAMVEIDEGVAASLLDAKAVELAEVAAPAKKKLPAGTA